VIAETFRWWLVVEAIGLLALPIALLVFRRLPGAGYAFSKPLGILLGGYLFWLALSLHILPNRPGSVVWVFILVAAVDAYLLRRYWAELRAAIEERLGYVIAVELVFLAAFFTAAHLRSYVPEIVATEKPMDFMLLNAASRSRYYPPDDAWLAGFGVSYYYFGYVLQAMIAKLAAVQTSVAFNLGLVSTAALALTAAFGLGYELAGLVRRVTFQTAVAVGVGALVLVGVIGNLEGVIEFGRANGAFNATVVENVGIANLEEAQESEACLLPSPLCVKYPTEASSNWWWWRATRISPEGFSITEFPFFSFLLGDLHPHVMALPFVLTAVGLGLVLWRSDATLSYESWRRQPALILLIAVMLGGLGFLNTWDLPTFGFLLALLVLARNLVGGRRPEAALRDSIRFMLPLVVLAALLYLPFWLSFSSQASGLEGVRGGATRPLHSFLFWGPLLAVSLPLPLALLAVDREASAARRVIIVACLPIALLFLWALLLVARDGTGALSDAIGDRGWNWLTTLFFAGALVVCLLALWRAVESPSEEAGAALVPVLTAMSVALLLVLGSELFYVQDVFKDRLNTVFKLTYQAWLLLAVSGAFGGFWLLRQRPAGRLASHARDAWAPLAALILAAALLYPLGATLSRTNGLAAADRTLDGLDFAVRQMPDEVGAITWLADRADRGEVVLEAVGGQYSPAARVAAWSGVPTVIGWPGHEEQWGRDGRFLVERVNDVDKAYTTDSLAEAEAILRKYGVTYVFVGGVERAKYAAAGLQKFEAGLSVAFRAGETVIYRLPPNARALTGAQP
jgi:YYY domain-containing protein